MDKQFQKYQIEVQIKKLIRKNDNLHKDIKKAYESGDNVNVGLRSVTNTVEECRSKVVSLTSKLRGNCRFAQTYLEKVDAVLSADEVDNIENHLRELKGKLLQKIEDHEEEIKRNEIKIEQLKRELNKVNSEIEMEKENKSNE